MAQPVSTVWARKLTAGHEESGGKPRSVLRALRLAFARAAGDLLQLPLSVIGAKQSGRLPEDWGDAVGKDWLLLQFFNSDGLSSAICLDLVSVSSIVQMQTIGGVTSDAPSPRAFTDTDAAMVAPLVEDALTRAAKLVEAPGDQVSLSGYEFTSRLPDLRSLSLAMTKDTYRVMELTVELGGGLRQGQISVLLPDLPEEVGESEPPLEEIGPNLEHASGVLRADLNTVICRMSLPLTALSGLEVGSVLPLTGSRLDRAEILTIDRNRAAVGRLGQCGGMRAVRLNENALLVEPGTAGRYDFLEAGSELSRNEMPEISNMADLPQGSGALDPAVTIDVETALNFADSDQMVAEISQLAGLTQEDGDPGSIG
ncbi:FliM/FliN family flagellar motor C-terminal domain-containing protein [Ruegeria halocynthiae]|uniref:FliM/FliN family flagellar motor C-terminal domain-containing protein n=1 Tax=Ruegeria halocynthiae TaxID=985054 RepID=UPI000568472E|nr:FliM/FliN family flagellar motor C-terminal domain-containing protein [Ruegeria halocynthiae]